MTKSDISLSKKQFTKFVKQKHSVKQAIFRHFQGKSSGTKFFFVSNVPSIPFFVISYRFISFYVKHLGHPEMSSVFVKAQNL